MRSIETIKREIAAVANATTTVYAVELVETVEIAAHGMAIPTGNYEYKNIAHIVPAVDESKLNALKAELDETAMALWGETYEAHMLAKSVQAKKARYKRELAEIESRAAYLRRWLAEN